MNVTVTRLWRAVPASPLDMSGSQTATVIVPVGTVAENVKGPGVPFAPALVNPLATGVVLPTGTISQFRVPSKALPLPATVTSRPLTVDPGVGVVITFDPADGRSDGNGVAGDVAVGAGVAVVVCVGVGVGVGDVVIDAAGVMLPAPAAQLVRAVAASRATSGTATTRPRRRDPMVPMGCPPRGCRAEP